MKILLYYILAIGMLTVGCQKENFSSSGFADDTFFLHHEGQNIPIRVCGNVDSKKMLLIVHGGPGGNGIDYRDSYVTENIEKQFAVIYWDQRFAGNSQGNGGNYDINTFSEDIKKIIQLIKNKYGNDQKIYIMGHSWGGFLTPYFLIQNQNQNLVNGWIQVDGAHNYSMNDSLTEAMLLYYGKQELNARRNVTFWQEVVDWCNTHSFVGNDNSGQLNAYAHQAEEKFDSIMVSDLSTAVANHQSLIANQINENIVSPALQIDAPAYQIKNSDQLYKITLPTLLVWGKYDFVCPPPLADDIVQHVGSKDVTSVIFNYSGHSPMVNQPKEFWDVLVEWINKH